MSPEMLPDNMSEAIFLTAKRSELNLIYSAECASASDHTQVSFLAEDRLSNGSAPSASLRLTLLAVPDSPTVPSGVLHLVPGIQVMILENKYPELLVMNGSIGHVMLTSDPAIGLKDAFVGIQFPWLADAGVNFPGLPPGTLIFKPRTLKFKYTPENCSGSITVRRTQFPFAISKAVPVHKYQGKTAKKGAIMYYSSQYTLEMLYVALSRVSQLSLLVICGQLPYSAFTRVSWPTSVKTHILDLKVLQASTLERAISLFPSTDDQALLDEEIEIELVYIRSLMDSL